ncbi:MULTISPECIES: hypothetical protein [Bacillus]|uniref:hypothetical protein n=1 Tax=Bacillus TaxID=1386 RepID=UPI0015967EB9|nr:MULTISPECIES: hypothetical protein [Bacillus]
MHKKAKERKQKQAHKPQHGVPENILKEEFGPELGDMNAAKAFEGAIASKKNKKKC